MTTPIRGNGKGLFITFEGVEGTGKSTHARRLADRLKQETDSQVVLSREPGGTPLGEAIRSVLLNSEEVPVPRTELLLMLAARAQHVDHVLIPSLNRGCIVICDRFSDASLAYQSGGRGLDFDSVQEADRIATGGLIPDVTVLLETTPEQTASRLKRRAAALSNRMDHETQTFYARVAKTYEQLALKHPQRVRRVQSDGAIDATSDAVWAVVAPKLAQITGAGTS
jgi:dTMP kinase